MGIAAYDTILIDTPELKGVGGNPTQRTNPCREEGTRYYHKGEKPLSLSGVPTKMKDQLFNIRTRKWSRERKSM